MQKMQSLQRCTKKEDNERGNGSSTNRQNHAEQQVRDTACIYPHVQASDSIGGVVQGPYASQPAPCHDPGSKRHSPRNLLAQVCLMRQFALRKLYPRVRSYLEGSAHIFLASICT